MSFFFLWLSSGEEGKTCDYGCGLVRMDGKEHMTDCALRNKMEET